jgi:hypothetical protein
LKYFEKTRTVSGKIYIFARKWGLGDKKPDSKNPFI